ncbi:MAG: ATP-binding cassette domain-containing protein [Ignavibacteriales bacterium]|nr:ATP-binding cassette domain-containing protein [Ignavibacteriales bacterium]MCF8315649.1 ATP-binding cassette domain-containing protein [Ignavibacteriales bacterium]MCF8437157.1 ATP-binding cassette domain-containing protein [Ignavibacteriales bacterium]
MKQFTFSLNINKDGKELLSLSDFRFPQNKISFLFGESGIGKTVASKAIYGLLNPDEFRGQINGKDYAAYTRGKFSRALRAGGFFVFQEPSTSFNALEKLTDQLREGDISFKEGEKKILSSLWGGELPEDFGSVIDIFPEPFRPSGGEKQRLLLAMAFKKLVLALNTESEEPSIFIFDEPTGNLDNRFRNHFLDLLLKRFREKPFTALFITHDYSIVKFLSDNHSEHKTDIRYYEFRKVNGALKQEEFDTGLLSGWLANLKKIGPQDSSGTVLELEPFVRVFDRSLVISDRNGKARPMTVRRGSIVYLKAPSGMGKTTISKIITGLQKAAYFQYKTGNHLVDDSTPQSYFEKHLWGKVISMTFQHADEALNPYAKVRNMLDGLPESAGLVSKGVENVLKLLFEEEIDSKFLNKRIFELSGGQKQKINLLRAMALRTEILILDEPVAGMDLISIKKVINLMLLLRSKGSSIILISHNEDIFDRIIPEENIYYITETKG